MSENNTILELPLLDHSDSWSDPILFCEVETPEIPAELLPNVLTDFAEALSNATETPKSLCVMSILGVISVCAAKYFKVSPKDGWEEPVNIYTLIALPPANNKSLVLKECTKPLVDWEKEQATQLEDEINRKRSERKTQEKIIDGLRVKAARAKNPSEQHQLIDEIVTLETNLVEIPVLPSLFTNDATPEALAILAHEQGGRFAIFSDEGGIMETLSGLYSHGNANVDILLKGIDGGEVRIKRKDRGLNINPYLTILLTVQPTIIQNMGYKRAYSGNGVLERFLYVIPKSKLGFRTHDKPSVSNDVREAYHHKIQSLLFCGQLLAANNNSQILTLSEDAKKAWRDFQNKVEKDLRPEGRLALCQGWGGKISGFALRIAGLLHIAEYESIEAVINEAVMSRALKITELLIDHSIAAYGLMSVDQTLQDAKEVMHWVKTNSSLTFTKSELLLAFRNKPMGKADRLGKALEVMIDRNLISEPQKLMTRKPTTVFYVNPALM